MSMIMGGFRALVGIVLLAAAAATPAAAQDTIKAGYAIQAHQANMMVLPQYAEKVGLKVDLVAMRRFPDLHSRSPPTNRRRRPRHINIALLEESGFKNYKVVSGVYVAPAAWCSRRM